MNKKLAHEKVYEIIRGKIKEGIWKKGDQIPTVKELSEEIGVGVSSVREAIRILVNQNILMPEQGRGTFVTDARVELIPEEFELLGSEKMLQLTQARLVIEPELAALAAINAGASEIGNIRSLAQEMDRKVRANLDFLKEDLEFHHAISKASRNEVLYKMMELISDMLRGSRRHTMKMKEMNKKASTYHLLIAKAIEDGHADQARSLMKAHIYDILLAMEPKPL